MKNSSLRLCALLVAFFSLVVLACAQNRERFGISAKAGGINAVSGNVTVKRADQEPQLLTNRDDLVSGDIVSTGYDSQVEVLLNPGTYLRLAEKSEFVLVDNSLDKLLVKLNQGSAIIEATGPDRIEQHIPIIAGQQRITILSAGVYRINVEPALAQLIVRKGRASLDGNPNLIVKSGKVVTIGGGAPVVAKLDKAKQDEFDDWSKVRGQTLARANQRLSARALNGYLSSGPWSWPGARFGRWGLWTFSASVGCYTFLPFYYGWGSPYGSNYGLYAWFGGPYSDGSCCRTYVNNSPSVFGNPTYGGAGSSGGSSGGGSPGGSGGTGSGSPAATPPPPRRIEPDSGVRIGNKIKEPD